MVCEGLLTCISDNPGVSVNVVLAKKYYPRKAVEKWFLPRLSFQNFPCYTSYGSEKLLFCDDIQFASILWFENYKFLTIIVLSDWPKIYIYFFLVCLCWERLLNVQKFLGAQNIWCILCRIFCFACFYHIGCFSFVFVNWKKLKKQFYNVNVSRACKDYQDHESSSKFSRPGMYQNFKSSEYHSMQMYLNSRAPPKIFPCTRKIYKHYWFVEQRANHNPIFLFSAWAQNGRALWLAGTDDWPLTICPLFFCL